MSRMHIDVYLIMSLKKANKKKKKKKKKKKTMVSYLGDLFDLGYRIYISVQQWTIGILLEASKDD